jgi:phage baseplate assembly protein gpV
MDINASLQPIIASMVNDLKASMQKELKDQVSAEVVKTLATTELTSIITSLITKQIQARVDKFDFVKTSDLELQKVVQTLTNQINKSLADSANAQISNFIKQKLSHVDIQGSIQEVIKASLSNTLTADSFPDGSISHTSINFDGLKITGDHITGGIITNFGSTGIEDRATFVQLTLMDHASAFEGPLYAPDLTVKGNVTVDGTLIVNGDVATNTPVFVKLVDQTSQAVRANLNTELFAGFSETIFGLIREDGLDLNKITQGGKEVVNGNRLGYHIVDTNIQRVGVLNDLQTSGENLFVDTLYVTNTRVGINTNEPSAVLAIWDEEVEIVVSKRRQDVGYINAPRNQKLILGSNGKENLIVNPDGSVDVDVLNIGTVSMSSDNKVPNYNGTAGQIVWNSAPAPGAAIGWVCLGATQWSKFGTIE